MKRAFLVVALGLLAVVARSLPAAALDCARAERPVEKMLCSTPELRQADDEMSAAYVKLLRETPDPDFHATLIRSQQRWLEARVLASSSFGPEAEGTPGKALLTVTRQRLDFLKSGRLIRVLEKQRKIMAKVSGGPFAGYHASSCDFWPPAADHGDWEYVCWSSLHRQHRDRICSVSHVWISHGIGGYIVDSRLVSVVKDGDPKAVASCTLGFFTSNSCPLEKDDGKHWEPGVDAIAGSMGDLLPDVSQDLWKYDPDAWIPSEDSWMDECLFAPVFPPPESSRPDAAP
jgi:uncharacterized protein YecT (DUF1311 family)